MIKKANLDYFLVQLFGQPELEQEEFLSLCGVIAGGSNRLFLPSPVSSLKPYLVGACLPGVILSFYDTPEVAQPAFDALQGFSVASTILSPALETKEVAVTAQGIKDRFLKVVFCPQSLLKKAPVVAQLKKACLNHGLIWAVAHDLLMGPKGEKAADALLKLLPSVFSGPEYRHSKIVTHPGDDEAVAFPPPERVATGLATSLTDEEKDELLKPLPPRPVPKLPAHAYEPELDMDWDLPSAEPVPPPPPPPSQPPEDEWGSFPTPGSPSPLPEPSFLDDLDDVLTPKALDAGKIPLPKTHSPDEDLHGDLEELLGDEAILPRSQPQRESPPPEKPVPSSASSEWDDLIAAVPDGEHPVEPEDTSLHDLEQLLGFPDEEPAPKRPAAGPPPAAHDVDTDGILDDLLGDDSLPDRSGVTPPASRMADDLDAFLDDSDAGPLTLPPKSAPLPAPVPLPDDLDDLLLPDSDSSPGLAPEVKTAELADDLMADLESLTQPATSTPPPKPQAMVPEPPVGEILEADWDELKAIEPPPPPVKLDELFDISPHSWTSPKKETPPPAAPPPPPEEPIDDNWELELERAMAAASLDTPPAPDAVAPVSSIIPQEITKPADIDLAAPPPLPPASSVEEYDAGAEWAATPDSAPAPIPDVSLAAGSDGTSHEVPQAVTDLLEKSDDWIGALSEMTADTDSRETPEPAELPPVSAAGGAEPAGDSDAETTAALAALAAAGTWASAPDMKPAQPVEPPEPPRTAPEPLLSTPLPIPIPPVEKPEEPKPEPAPTPEPRFTIPLPTPPLPPVVEPRVTAPPPAPPAPVPPSVPPAPTPPAPAPVPPPSVATPPWGGVPPAGNPPVAAPVTAAGPQGAFFVPGAGIPLPSGDAVTPEMAAGASVPPPGYWVPGNLPAPGVNIPGNMLAPYMYPYIIVNVPSLDPRAAAAATTPATPANETQATNQPVDDDGDMGDTDDSSRRLKRGRRRAMKFAVRREWPPPAAVAGWGREEASGSPGPVAAPPTPSVGDKSVEPVRSTLPPVVGDLSELEQLVDTPEPITPVTPAAGPPEAAPPTELATRVMVSSPMRAATPRPAPVLDISYWQGESQSILDNLSLLDGQIPKDPPSLRARRFAPPAIPTAQLRPVTPGEEVLPPRTLSPVEEVVEALSTPDRSPSPVSEDAVVARLTGAFKSPPPAAEPPGPTFVRTGEPLRDGLLVELGLVEATSPNRPEPITPVAVAPPPEPVPPVPPLPAVRLPEVPEVRHEPPAPVTSPARSGIQGQVSEVLQSILDDHPDERTRRATHQALPQEPAPRWHTTERGSEKPVQQPIERPIERPLERPVEREIERAIERPIERPMERPVPPPFDLPAERPAERHPVSVPGVARDIRQVVDLSRESHAYFYEIDQSYESRNNYLTRLWDDPDANVDAFTNQLLQIERAVPEDARTPFALGVLQLLAQRRVQGLTGLNRSLDLLTEQHDAEGITVVLSVLHTAFPDDVGISERLVEILERTGRKKEAAAVLFQLGEGVLARDNPRRALTYLERAGSQDPENRGVIMLQIRAYRSIGQEDRVLEAANRGQDEWPDDPVLLLHKAEALAKLGRQKAAEVCMDKAFREAGTNLSVLKIFKDELTTARDERNARRAADQIEALTDGPAEPRRVPDVPSFVAPPVEPVRPVEQVRRVDPKPASPPPVRPPPPVDIPPPRPAAPLAAQDADGDFFARLRKKLPKISQDVKNLQDLESSVRSRKERDSVDDQHLAELLRQFQVVGDKLKATAPDDASQVFHRGMSYLGWFRDLMFAVVWRDDFEKRIKACLNAKR